MDVCHAIILSKIKHHIRTSFGIFKDTILWDIDSNPGVLGQGNGGGHVSWYSQMLILEHTYEGLTEHKVEYNNPDATRKFGQWLVSFVDNNFILF